jgi:flavodoxin
VQTLIIYDSQFGNTEKIARAIGEAIGEGVKVVHASQADPDEMTTADLQIIGAPTQGGRATPPVRDLLKAIKRQGLKDKRAAAFDTRISAKWVGLFGYAAGRIGKELLGKGATLVVPPEPFFVTSDKVPQLPEGELERAAAWAREVVSKTS